MSTPDPVIRNISETAQWAALFRAQETERPNAVFRDPLARRLAGPRAEEIVAALGGSKAQAWAWVTRTYLFDQYVTEQVKAGVDLVVNLAAGLDARPYRMDLPKSLRWVEVDLPELLGYKEDVLRGETPACHLERIPLDLANVGARRQLFAKLGASATKALIITEGLLIYLSAEDVAALAKDLGRQPSFRYWALEVASPGLLQMLQKQIGEPLKQAKAPLKFGPPEGPGFFTAHGWRPIAVRSMLKTAARLKRVSLLLRLIALLPESKGPQGSRPWSGVCLMERQDSAPS
jgi:methyltransferase (TIGR00027 family)